LPRNEKKDGALPDGLCRICAGLKKQIHAPQTANTSFGTIPRGSRIMIDARTPIDLGSNNLETLLCKPDRLPWLGQT